MVRTIRIAPVVWITFLDHKALLERRWKLLGPGASQHDRNEAELTRMCLWRDTNLDGLWQPRAIYEIFPARITDGVFTISRLGAAAKPESLQFTRAFVNRQTRLHPEGETFTIALQLVTAGEAVTARCRELARQGRIYDQFLLHGLAAELTEALAEYAQREIQRAARWPRAKRYSPGYPVWPELSEQQKIFRLLKAEKIGVRLTENYQMVPEYSTSAIIIPAAGSDPVVTKHRS